MRQASKSQDLLIISNNVFGNLLIYLLVFEHLGCSRFTQSSFSLWICKSGKNFFLYLIEANIVMPYLIFSSYCLKKSGNHDKIAKANST